jgi:hypothetical protein
VLAFSPGWRSPSDGGANAWNSALLQNREKEKKNILAPVERKVHHNHKIS